MITPLEPNVAPSGRYSTMETCRALGIHRDTLRTYTEVKKLIKCGVRKFGNRYVKFYLGSEILRFWKSQA